MGVCPHFSVLGGGLTVVFFFSNTILPPRQSTPMVSFGAKRPSRIAFASGFSISDWIARLSGRAP
jgi:hypothetical protein